MKNMKKKLFLNKIVVSCILLLSFSIIFGTVYFVKLHAQNTQQAEKETVVSEKAAQRSDEVLKFALLSAAIAFGFGAIGAGIAIANVGAAAMGAIGEKPEIANQALIFIALGEGLVVFGFIMALMILGKA